MRLLVSLVSPGVAADRPYVAVVGGGRAGAWDLAAAETTGAELARRGAVVVCGGLGGVMEAACRGAKAGGGTTLGVLPGDHRGEANSFVDVAVVTAMGEGRNVIVVRTADAVVAVGGEYGTLSEIALALALAKPVVGLGTWGLAAPDGRADAVVRANSPEEAAQTALRLVSQRR